MTVQEKTKLIYNEKLVIKIKELIAKTKAPERCLTNSEVAEQAGISTAQINGIIEGKVKEPSIRVLMGLSKALDIPLLDLSMLIEAKNTKHPERKQTDIKDL